jgi:hypothetical protein
MASGTERPAGRSPSDRLRRLDAGALCGALDEVRGRGRLRDVDRVAAGRLGDRRAGAGPTWFAARGGGIMPAAIRYQLGLSRQAGSVGGAVERLDAPRDLRVGHEGRVLCRQVRRERGRELLPVEEQEAVDRRQDRRLRPTGREAGDQGVDGFPASSANAAI